MRYWRKPLDLDQVKIPHGEVVIIDDRCKGCGLCIVACPTGSLEIGSALNRLGYHPVEFLPETGCTACGVCYYACPEPAALAAEDTEDVDIAQDAELAPAEA